MTEIKNTQGDKIAFDMDTAKFDAALLRIGDAAAGEALGAAATAAALVLVAQAKINIESNFVIHPIGPLKASVGVGSVTATRNQAIAEWGSYGIVYARIHEYGGVILATNGPYLVFQTADGAWHSVPMVTMPARPYIRPAIDQHGRDAAKAAEFQLAQRLRLAIRQ